MVEKIKKVEKKLRSPSAFTVLFVVIALMAALTWVIPSGQYKLDKDGNRESGTYSKVDKQKIVDLDDSGEPKKDDDGNVVTHDGRQGLWDAFIAPIKGMSEKLDVIVFVLILGGFLGVTMKTGALDATLGALLRKMKGKEKWLIPILMTFFSIGDGSLLCARRADHDGSWLQRDDRSDGDCARCRFWCAWLNAESIFDRHCSKICRCRAK